MNRKRSKTLVIPGIYYLICQKDRLEKLIANILNWEGYSKLEQTVKENVKAVLAENKQLISVSFLVLIQTLKADPQMVKLIYNTPARNNGEQLKNDDNNIKKYPEFNRDRYRFCTKELWKPCRSIGN